LKKKLPRDFKEDTSENACTQNQRGEGKDWAMEQVLQPDTQGCLLASHLPILSLPELPYQLSVENL
jgi:hypothetical protein